MAEKRRMTADEWAQARRRWEDSPTEGYDWLAVELRAALGIEISRPAVAKMAKTKGWAKRAGRPEAGAKVTPSVKVTPVKQVTPAAKVTAEAKVTPEVPAKPAKPLKRGLHPPARQDSGDAHPVDLEPGEKPPGYPGAGRPSKYRAEYAQMMIDYFTIDAFENVITDGRDGNPRSVAVASKFPTFARFATTIGVTSKRMLEWRAAEREDGAAAYPEFREAYTRAKEMQEVLLVEGGLAGAFDARIVQFSLKNLADWKDKTEVAVEVAPVSVDALNQTFFSKMMAAHTRMEAVLAGRAQLLSDDCD